MLKRVRHPDGGCFICEKGSLFDVWYFFEPESDSAWCEIEFNENHQGPPGAVHGGIIATILDEVMSMATGNYFPSYLANLTVKYKMPVPLSRKVRVEAKVVRKSGRKIWVEGKIVFDDGRVAVESTGLYIQPKNFEKIPLKEAE